MSIQCICPSDVTLAISHSQVSVLPNFAMTDYALQGKTHPFNLAVTHHTLLKFAEMLVKCENHLKKWIKYIYNITEAHLLHLHALCR